MAFLTQPRYGCLIQASKLYGFFLTNIQRKKILVLENLKNAGLSYEDATQLWKHHPELSHIKLIRCKGSFGKCKVCLAYELKIRGKLSVAEREKADTDFLAHIAETKKERAQYATDQIKCSEEDDKFVIIMDSIDKYKTTFPFFINPPKSVLEGETLVSTKLTVAMVHGFGAGVYCYWASDQVCHDTNFTIVYVVCL